jgi:hypothetical protein
MGVEHDSVKLLRLGRAGREKHHESPYKSLEAVSMWAMKLVAQEVA